MATQFVAATAVLSGLDNVCYKVKIKEIIDPVKHGPLAIGTYHKNWGLGDIGPLFSVFITVIEVNFADV